MTAITENSTAKLKVPVAPKAALDSVKEAGIVAWDSTSQAPTMCPGDGQAYKRSMVSPLDLDAAGTLDGTELVPVVQGGVAKRITLDDIAGAPQSLDDLTDVDTSGASSGDVLTLVGAEWVPRSGGLRVYESYNALVASGESSTVALVDEWGLFEKVNNKWIPSPGPSKSLAVWGMEIVGNGGNRQVNCPSGAWIAIRSTPTFGKIFAVAYAGTNRLIVSSDGGNSWEVASLSASYTWRDVCCANNNGRIYAFNTDHSLYRAAVSSDGGVSWADKATPSTADIVWRSACWDPAHDRVVAVGYGSSTANNSMYIQNDATFYSGTNANNNALLSVCYDSKRNRVVAVGNTGALDRCQVSSDGGSSWATRNMPSESGWKCIVYAALPDILVASSYDSGIAYSEDGGDTWNVATGITGAVSGLCYSVEYNRVIALTNSYYYFSDDGGKTFTAGVEQSGLSSPYFCEWDSRTKTLLACGYGSDTKIAKTPGIHL